MLEEMLPLPEEDPSGPFHAGRIASAPDADDRVTVTLPGYAPDLRHGPAPYMPRGEETPSRGDRCLVVFDDEDSPWVLAWEPAA